MEDTIESGYAIIYCRVSTTIQRDEGQSIEFQIAGDTPEFNGWKLEKKDADVDTTS